MSRRWLALVVAGALGVGMWAANPTPVQAQTPQSLQLNRFYHYPYYYFPHNYWPLYGPRWPERQGQPYMRPPAYMAYPPFREPNWRYELWEPQRYYRGHHFWLDQF